ncbi:MAG: hypothetical protein Kow00121_05170 [Elainellaceae cyanobacterium]
MTSTFTGPQLVGEKRVVFYHLSLQSSDFLAQAQQDEVEAEQRLRYWVRQVLQSG